MKRLVFKKWVVKVLVTIMVGFGATTCLLVEGLGENWKLDLAMLAWGAISVGCAYLLNKYSHIFED